MAASAWTFASGNKVKFFDGTHDLDGDTFKLALFDSAWSPKATYDSTNELATANGYTQGGKEATNPSASETGGTVSIDMDDVAWTAAGGDLTARYAVLYNDSDAGKAIVAYILLDDAPADVTVTDGNTLTIQISNVFTAS